MLWKANSVSFEVCPWWYCLHYRGSRWPSFCYIYLRDNLLQGGCLCTLYRTLYQLYICITMYTSLGSVSVKFMQNYISYEMEIQGMKFIKAICNCCNFLPIEIQSMNTCIWTLNNLEFFTYNVKRFQRFDNFNTFFNFLR